MIRLVLGLPVAAVITVGLFLLMRYLILVEFQEQDETDTTRIEITRDIRDESTRVKDRKPDRPVEENLPPPPPPPTNLPQDMTELDASVAGINPDFGTDVTMAGLQAAADTTAIPLVRVVNFPDSCASRGLSGWVQLEFNLTAGGLVQDPKIVGSSSSCFERSAMRDIKKWKYRPKIRDGAPAPAYGIQQVITYQLQE